MIELGILAGGMSFEHDFTIKSLNYLIQNIALYHSKKFLVKKIYYLSKDNHLYVFNLESGATSVTSADLVGHGKKFNSRFLPEILFTDKLFVFSVLQGLYGEDGHIQALSSLYDIPGNLDNILSAAITSNKWIQSSLVNHCLKEHLSEINTKILYANASETDLDLVLSHFNEGPCILKPNSLGGSIMVESVYSLNKTVLENYLKRIKYFDQAFLVQERIFGQEIACCCLINREKVTILPILGVDQEGVLMDYNEKYKINKHKWIFYEPSLAIKQKLKNICQSINHIFKFNTYCRFDFIIKDNAIYLLEINNVPGIYQSSLFIRSLEKANFNTSNLLKLAYKNWQHVFKGNLLIRETIRKQNSESLEE